MSEEEKTEIATNPEPNTEETAELIKEAEINEMTENSDLIQLEETNNTEENIEKNDEITEQVEEQIKEQEEKLEQEQEKEKEVEQEQVQEQETENVADTNVEENKSMNEIVDGEQHVNNMGGENQQEVSEIDKRMDIKYDVKKEIEARTWIEAVIGEKVFTEQPETEAYGSELFCEALKPGIILCKLINALTGTEKIKMKSGDLPFQQMERVSQFIHYSIEYGVRNDDLFTTTDLFDKQNSILVLNGIEALARKARQVGFDGPTFGPKESERQERGFTKEQLDMGKTIIGLQMGSNKGASQAGMFAGGVRDLCMKMGDKLNTSGGGNNIVGLQMGKLENKPPKASSMGNRRDITSHLGNDNA